MIQKNELGVNLARKQLRPDYTVAAGYFNMGRMPDMFQFRVDIPLPIYSGRKQIPAVHEQAHRLSESRRNYEAARQDGRTAGLLEQERPNVFTQSLANIPPGEAIEIELRVVQPLRRQDGRYALVLPTVVGPRYVPGAPLARAPDGAFAPDTDRVSDVSRITPMPRLSGPAPCPNVSIRVAIESGARARDVRSKHHDV